MRSHYKFELAEAMGVSTTTMNRWLRPHQGRLAELGNAPRCKILNPAGVAYLCEFFCIDAVDLPGEDGR